MYILSWFQVSTYASEKVPTNKGRYLTVTIRENFPFANLILWHYLIVFSSSLISFLFKDQTTLITMMNPNRNTSL